MWWQYLLVFLGAFLFDVVPFPFPPAFTIMVTLKILFDLDTWWVIILGVLGSIAGRYTLTLYIPLLADKIFKPQKNKEVQFLGEKISEEGWKSQMVILTYSLMPLPTTPLFLAAGMARLKPIQIIPAFFVGKFISDAIAVHLGDFASEGIDDILNEALSWNSILSLVLSLLFIAALLFIDWFALIEKKQFRLNFRIWK
ncbi:Transmembrane protein [Flavobacterium daejeonense]|nr:Transmembrane protein [Flavobacterium daejeonense]